MENAVALRLAQEKKRLVADIFKGIGEAIGKDLRVPRDLLSALEQGETLALLNVREVSRSANERFTEGSVHGGSRHGGSRQATDSPKLIVVASAEPKQ